MPPEIVGTRLKLASEMYRLLQCIPNWQLLRGTRF